MNKGDRKKSWLYKNIATELANYYCFHLLQSASPVWLVLLHLIEIVFNIKCKEPAMLTLLLCISIYMFCLYEFAKKTCLIS